MLDDNDGYDNGISHYMECREGYDRVVAIEQMGAKARDVDGEFERAEFATKRPSSSLPTTITTISR